MVFINRKMRFDNWNYSAGCYHVTICTKNREKYLGEIRNNKMHLSKKGIIALDFLKKIPDHFKNVILDVFILMPDHVHLILHLTRQTVEYYFYDLSYVGVADLRHLHENKPQSNAPINKRTKMYLSKIIHGYKSSVTREINKRDLGCFQWQRSFYDHRIYGFKELNQTREYILNNINE